MGLHVVYADEGDVPGDGEALGRVEADGQVGHVTRSPRHGHEVGDLLWPAVLRPAYLTAPRAFP